MLKIHRDPQTNGAGNNQAPVIDPPPAIDFDALTRPEGAMALDVNGPNLDNLPNLDPPPPAPNTQQTQANTQTLPPNPNPNPNPDPNADPNLDPFPFKQIKNKESRDLIERLANKYGENFKLPEDVTDENLFEHVENTLRPQVDLHPEVAKINDAIKTGVPFEQILKGYNQMQSFKELPNKDLVTQNLKAQFGKTEKNPNGWEESKITDMVTKMENAGLLDIEAEKIRFSLDEKQKEYVQGLRNAEIQRRKTEIDGMNTAREQEIKSTYEQFSKLNDVFGIPLSQSEKVEFADDLRYLVTPNDKGVAPVLEWLQSNDNLAKVAYLMKKGDAKIKEALLAAKNSGKNGFMQKLDKEPRLPQKQTPTITPEIDYDALARPALT